MKRSVRVSVPASSGNLGPGFDVLGLALSLRNELTVRVLGPEHRPPVIDVEGEGEDSLVTDSRNVIYQAVRLVFSKARAPLPWLELFCLNRIPLARGLGSSAAARLSGLLAGNALLGKRFSDQQILTWATELEGHPDNVAPALYGGIRASAHFNGYVVSSALPVPGVRLVAAVPEFHLSTKRARQVLPRAVPLQDAVFNLSAVGLLPHALGGNYGMLKDLLNDRLHEPYRARLIPGFYAVKKAAQKAGAYGTILSGAGPTILSFVPRAKVAGVSRAMTGAFRRAGIKSEAMVFTIDRKGAEVR